MFSSLSLSFFLITCLCQLVVLYIYTYTHTYICGGAWVAYSLVALVAEVLKNNGSFFPSSSQYQLGPHLLVGDPRDHILTILRFWVVSHVNVLYS